MKARHEPDNKGQAHGLFSYEPRANGGRTLRLLAVRPNQLSYETYVAVCRCFHHRTEFTYALAKLQEDPGAPRRAGNNTNPDELGRVLS